MLYGNYFQEKPRRLTIPFFSCLSATEQWLRRTKKVNLNLLRMERMARVFTHNYHYSFKSTHRSCDYHLNVGNKFLFENRSPLRLFWIVSFWQLSMLAIVWSGLLLRKIQIQRKTAVLIWQNNLPNTSVPRFSIRAVVLDRFLENVLTGFHRSWIRKSDNLYSCINCSINESDQIIDYGSSAREAERVKQMPLYYILCVQM